MSPIIVYRFEHPEDRSGPWEHGNYHNAWLDAHTMLCSWHDVTGLHLHGMHGRSGVINEVGLRFFTGNDRRKLRDEGFVLSTYMCPPGTVDFGKFQVKFDIDEAIRVKERKP